jgi:hypothetical protein
VAALIPSGVSWMTRVGRSEPGALRRGVEPEHAKAPPSPGPAPPSGSPARGGQRQ